MPTLQTQSGLAGQYGYANGAPILNASVARNLLGNEFYKPLDIERNDLGWGTNSRYQGAIRTGVGLYGIQGNRDEILQLLDIGQRAKQDFAAGRIIATQDPETGQVRYAELVDTEAGPQYSIPAAYQRFAIGGEEGSNPMQNFARWQDITSKLQNAAQSLGIPTTGLTDRQLFDAINAVDTRVAVTGRTQFWDPAQAGIGGQQGPQHATVVYSEQDGRLVPISAPQTFTFQDPNTTRGFFGDIFKNIVEIISIPPIAAALGAYAFGPGGLLGGEAAAAGTGLTPGAAGVTGLTPGAAGITGITAPAGFTFAPGVGATVGAVTPSLLDTARSVSNVIPTSPGTTITPPVAPAPAIDYSLLSNANIPATIPEMGASGVIPGSGGIGLQAPTMPNIAAMGGGQGLTVPVVGGTVGAMGLTPTAAVPVLGSPSSIINQPEVLGQPVMAQGSPTSPISPTDVLRASNALQQLTQQPQPQAPQTPEQTGQSGPLGVDYSQLLNLLANQARTTGLLGTRFQPTPVNLSSLLG